MEHEHEWRVTGPSGTLAQRVGDHVASANQLLQQSRRAVSGCGPAPSWPTAGSTGPTGASRRPAARSPCRAPPAMRWTGSSWSRSAS